MDTIERYYSQSKITKCYSTSTFLIPDRYLVFFNQQCKRHGSRRAYLGFMVTILLPQVHLFEQALKNRSNRKWKTDYQKEGQVLQRRNFVPLPDDWEEFRNFSSAFGVSMCFLFVFLMEQDMAGVFSKRKHVEYKCWNSVDKITSKQSIFNNMSKFVRLMNIRGQKLIRTLQMQ